MNRSNNLFSWKNIFSILILLAAFYFSPPNVRAQLAGLDNLTNDEDELIRDTEEMDARTDVYVHIVDRRLLSINDPNAAASKQAEKDLEKYGKLRTGTSAKLYADIERTLSEVIGKFDDVAERDQKNPEFVKSIKILTKACERWIPQFKTGYDKAADDAEKIPITNSIQECNDVIEASSKLPNESPKDKKKSKNDSN